MTNNLVHKIAYAFCMVVLSQVAQAGDRDVVVNQNAKLNISIVQLKEARGSKVDVDQTGTGNFSVITQIDNSPVGQVNSLDYTNAEVNQDGQINASVIGQDTYLNNSNVRQDASDRPPSSTWSDNEFTITMTDGTIESHYKSGDVDIYTQTDRGYAAVSSFGRGH